MKELEVRVRDALHDVRRSDEAPTVAEITPTSQRLRSTPTTRRTWVAPAVAAGLAALVLVVGTVVVLDRSEQVAPTTSPGDPLLEPSAERDAAMYVAALERFLRPGDRDWPAEPVVYVVTSPREEAQRSPGSMTAIPPGVQEAVRDALAPAVSLRWIGDPDPVGCDLTRDGAIVVTLDTLTPLPTDYEEVSISATRYQLDRGCSVNSWLNTYVVEATTSGWEVTGTTGPLGIS